MAEERVLTLDEDNFDETIQDRPGIIVVDFRASWCAPCNKLEPILVELVEELGRRATLVRVDVDENGDLANRFGVRSIPTLVLFQDGRIVDRMIGLHSKSEIRDRIDRLSESGGS